MSFNPFFPFERSLKNWNKSVKKIEEGDDVHSTPADILIHVVMDIFSIGVDSMYLSSRSPKFGRLHDVGSTSRRSRMSGRDLNVSKKLSGQRADANALTEYYWICLICFYFLLNRQFLFIKRNLCWLFFIFAFCQQLFSIIFSIC